MTGKHPTRQVHRWIATVLTVAAAGLIVSVAGAAQRVVLGEYFTNLY